MEQQYDRDFKGIWIPKEIWLNKELSALEKAVFAEIDSLDTDKGCYASNEYIAQFCNCSVSKVAHAIARLKELDLIYVKSFDGRTRFLGSRLAKNAKQTCKKCKADLQKKHNINIEDNIDDNTLINKSKEHTQKSTKFYKPTLEEVREYVKANNLNVDPENWYDYYESNGWHVGKSKMSKWKSCISRWSRSESKKKKPKYDVEDMNADESVDLVARRKELFGE